MRSYRVLCEVHLYIFFLGLLDKEGENHMRLCLVPVISVVKQEKKKSNLWMDEHHANIYHVFVCFYYKITVDFLLLLFFANMAFPLLFTLIIYLTFFLGGGGGELVGVNIWCNVHLNVHVSISSYDRKMTNLWDFQFLHFSQSKNCRPH